MSLSIRINSRKLRPLPENECWSLAGRKFRLLMWPLRPVRCFPKNCDSGRRAIELSQIFFWETFGLCVADNPNGCPIKVRHSQSNFKDHAVEGNELYGLRPIYGAIWDLHIPTIKWWNFLHKISSWEKCSLGWDIQAIWEKNDLEMERERSVDSIVSCTVIGLSHHFWLKQLIIIRSVQFHLVKDVSSKPFLNRCTL